MRSHCKSRLAAAAMALAASIALAACGTSVASLRQAAEANANKYYELISAGDYEGAFKQTFSDTYRQQLQIDTFVRYQQRYAAELGGIQGYKAIETDVDQERGTATITYALDVGKLPEPVNEVVRLRLQGTEWRIDSVEPKVMRQRPGAAPHSDGAPHAPQGAPGR
jgi:hypothetical protein